MLVALEPGASADRVAHDVTLLGPSTFETSFGTDVFRDQADPTLSAMATGLRVVALIVALAGGIVLAQALARAATDRLGDHEGIRALGATRSELLLQLSLPSAAGRRGRHRRRWRAQRRGLPLRAVGPGAPSGAGPRRAG